jgi:hypothetical protein
LYIDGIKRKYRVPAEENGILYVRLSDEQAVERVFVVHR